MISRDWMVTWWWLHDDLWELKGDLRVIWWRISWWFHGDSMVISWKYWWCIGDCFWVIFCRDLMVKNLMGFKQQTMDLKADFDGNWTHKDGDKNHAREFMAGLWLSLPLWKMMDFVSWDYDIPNIWKKCSKAPTRYFWICSEYLWTWQKYLWI